MANATIGSAMPDDLVAFTHVALFNPAISTLAEVLRYSHLPEFAGLTLQQLHQHPPVQHYDPRAHGPGTTQELHQTKTSSAP